MIFWRPLLMLVFGLTCASMALEAKATIVTLDHANAVLQPEGQLERQVTVRLRHNWDKDFPRVGGRATYTMHLSGFDVSTPHALLFERVGNQARIKVNGVVLREFGELGNPSTDSGKSSQLASIPPGILHAAQSNVVVVEVSMQALRGGGLSAVAFGPAVQIEAMQAKRRLFDQSAAAGYAAGFLLMGGLSAGLWWRQRDALYGCFSLAALFGTVRHLDRVLESAPLSWPTWGAVLAMAYGCHLALIARFILLVLGSQHVMLIRAVYCVLVLVMVLASASFWLLVPELWTGSLVMLELIGLACFGVVLNEAFCKQRRIARLLLGAGSAMLLAGIHDIVMVRMGFLGGSDFTWTPHAMFFLVLVLAGIVVERYSRVVTDYRSLNEHLAERVAQREQQLNAASDSLRVQREEQVVLDERQRLMREIHDGIGSHLVGLLNMVNKPHADPKAMQEQVSMALDEMRMAVDSLQPVQGDLTTVLATLRYRLQARLHAAGIDVVWNVQKLAPMPELSPQTIWQVQRILLEAFTNVLKHAGASSVTVDASHELGGEPAVTIQITDNGVGFATLATAAIAGGHGIANMHARAAAAGVTLQIEPGRNGGTCVRMRWKLASEAASSSMGKSA
jgi:signal transduction histidine kinase